MAYEEEQPAAVYQGFFSKLQCQECGEMFEIEDDVSNGEDIECDACGASLEVSGR